MPYSHIDKPIRIGRSIELKNRIFRAAHATQFGDGGVTDKLIDYHAARAAGGAGLSFIEILSVHPTSPCTLRIYQPGIEKGYRKLVETVRPHGMKLFQQLWHAGHARQPLDGGPPWSSSDVPNPKIHAVPVPMTKGMIDEIVESFANSARLLEAFGMDGAEVHSAHGYLVHQFLTPNTNKREDEYGGTLENRARFLIEILTAMRAAVSPDFAIGIRVGPDATVGGVGSADTAKVIKMVEDRNLIDFVNCSMGSYHSYAKMIGGMHEPVGYELDTSIPAVRQARTPRMVIGRFRTLEEADQILRADDADMIGMVRATIADPDIIKKSLAGDFDRIRPCIACNQACAARPTGQVGCAVNPAVGFERELSESNLAPAKAPLHILIVGGGPAGLEAARTAALRGHRVTLAEAQPRLGGAFRIAAQAPTRHGMVDILDWLEREIYALGVSVKLSSYMQIDDIVAERPDKVIIATGSLPRMDGLQVSNPGEPIQGFQNPKVVSSNDLFLNGVAPDARRAVVIDDLGHYEAVGVAEQLIASGLAVEYVTRHSAFAPMMDPAHMVEPALARLSRGTFSVRARTRALSIDEEGVTIAPTFAYMSPSNAVTKLPADVVVFVSANRPNRELYDDLMSRKLDVMIVGDANQPRFLESAIREGRIAGAHC